MDGAASIITLVELTISISSVCIEYVRDVSHAAEEAAALHKELASLLLVLSRLQLPSVSSTLKMELEPDFKICEGDLLTLQAKLKPAEGLRKIRQNLLWPFKKQGEFKKTTTRIQRHFAIFEKAVVVSTLEVVADIKTQLAELRQLRESDRDFIAKKFVAIGADVTEIKQSAKDDKRDKLLEWLKVVDYESNHRDNVSLAAPSTGSWFFGEKGYFAQWLRRGEGSPRNILVQGEAGAGKTVLMSSAVQTALAFPFPPSSKICVGYYYFDFRNSQKVLASVMLSSLMHQLVVRTSTLPEAIEKLRSNHLTPNLVPLTELAEILQQQCSAFDTTFFFIDALDECEKVDGLLEILTNMSRNTGSSADVRFMCFSRDEGGIKRVLESSGFSTRPLEHGTVGQDIATYVRETLRGDASGKFRVFQDSSEKLREDVINKLVLESGGMFRWVQCQMDEISRCRTAREIRDAINDLPATLVETYERMFKRMSKSDLSKAKRILSWLIGTDGAMTSNMLIEALTIDFTRLELDGEDRLRNPDEIRDICRSLVRESDHRYKLMWPDCKIIGLAHFSVAQYLMSPQAGEFRLDLRTVHLQLARACLAYSTSSIWEPLVEAASKDDFIPDASAEVVQFLDYTCGDVFSHIQYDNVEVELLRDVIGLLQQDQRLKNLQRNCSVINVWGEHYTYPFESGLHISVREGQWNNAMTQVLGGLLRIDHTSSFLSKAVVAGLYPTSFSLIENRIGFDLTDTFYQTPLAFIVATGRIDVIRRFILKYREQHQSATSQNLPEAESILESILGSTVNALFTAITIGWADASHMLFGEALISLDLFHDRSYGTKVYRMVIRLCVILSAAKGNWEVVASVRSHASSSDRMDARALRQLEEELLYVSVCEGNAEYVQELLDRGVSPTARINLPSNLRLLNDEITLESANKYWAGYLKPEVFLDEVDKRRNDWEYSEKEPKIIATAGMRDPVLAPLLLGYNNGVVLDNKDVFVEVVESWLLRPDAQEHTEALEEMQDLLYDHMQRSGNKEKLNLALVICAGKSRGTQAVRQLLARDADPNCSVLDEAYRDASTPLVAACHCANLESVKLLLDAGADPNLESQSGMIPSVAAVADRWSFGKELLNRQRVFDLLKEYDPGLKTSSTRALSKPPPVFEKNGFGSRPGSVLSAVIMRCSGSFGDEIPREFLKSNGLLDHLDNYLPGDDYGTPLIAASATGQDEFVDLLLEHGATINATGHAETEWSHPALAAIFAQRWDLALKFLEQFDTSCIKTSEEQRKWSMALMVALGAAEYRIPNPPVALKLIECGVNVNFTMDEVVSSSILCEAKRSSDQCMDHIKSILSDRGSPLYAACGGGDASLIKKLQELKASEVATPAASSGDCLTAACGSEEAEAVEIFLQRGDDVNKCSPGRERWCPLVSAAQSGPMGDIVSLLLGKGARANKSYQFKNPAAEAHSLETLTLTLGQSLHFSLLWRRMWDDCTITGPSLLQAKPFFGTPMIAAAYSRDEDAIELIAKQEGVDVNQEVKCGIYPTAMMATLDMKKMYRATGPLRELGATEITASQMLNFSHPFRALTSDVVKENVGTTVPGSFWGNMITLCVNAEMAIPYLLQQGADPNEVVSGSFYGSAFIAASALLRSGTVSLFLERGCDVNVVVPESPFGTPLIAVCAGPAHYPFLWGFYEEFNLNDPPNWSMVQYDLLEMLLDRDADPNVTHNEFSPLIALMLCDCEEEYKMKGIKLLRDHGADPGIELPQWGYDQTAGKHWSAISIAEAKGQEAILEILR